MTEHDHHAHHGVSSHDGGHHHGHDAAQSLNQTAFQATVHCLTGCAIGEVLGMVIGTALGLSNLATITLAIVLAFFFGYALTLIPLLRARLALPTALGLAFASDTASITIMEIVDNAIMLVIPGAMDAGLLSVKRIGSCRTRCFLIRAPRTPFDGAHAKAGSDRATSPVLRPQSIVAHP